MLRVSIFAGGCSSWKIKQQWNLPESVLEDISTENLIQIISEYPYIADIHAYDSAEFAISEMAKQFNALEELIMRDGCRDLLEFELKMAEGDPDYDKSLIALWEAVISANSRIRTERMYDILLANW